MVGIPREMLDGKRDGKGVDCTGETHGTDGTDVRRGYRETRDAKNTRARFRSVSKIVQQNSTIHSLFYL